jgi:hypothetical protein
VSRFPSPKIELKLLKNTYSVGESVEVLLVLKNRSDVPLTVNKRMGFNPGYMAEGDWEVKFNITFPPGKRLLIDTLINPENLEKEDFTTLPPARELSKSVILTDYYWMKLPGTYSVTATYHNTEDGSKFGFTAWMGDIISNSVTFNVTE